MKKIGIVGGIGPESTIEYYRALVSLYRERIPDGSYPSIIINSIDLKRLLELVTANDRAKLAEFLAGEIEILARAGAEVGLVAANTPHMVFDEVRRLSSIPLVSIVEATRDVAKELGLKRLGLFGARYTVQARFYPEVFSKVGMAIVVPDEADQTFIHGIYFNELVKGIVSPETRERLFAIVDRMKQRDSIQGLILGGTELSLILRDATARDIPVLDTTRIHAKAIVDEALL